MKEVYAQVTGWTRAQRSLRHSLWKYIEEPQSSSRCRATHTGNYVLEEKGGVRYEMDLENNWHKKDKPLDFPENHQAFVLLVFLCTICWSTCFPPQQQQRYIQNERAAQSFLVRWDLLSTTCEKVDRKWKGISLVNPSNPQNSWTLHPLGHWNRSGEDTTVRFKRDRKKCG